MPSPETPNFPTARHGYNPQPVDQYIEELQRECHIKNDHITWADREIRKLQQEREEQGYSLETIGLVYTKAQAEADRILQKAQEEANRIVQGADRILQEAQEKANQILAEAQEKADYLTTTAYHEQVKQTQKALDALVQKTAEQEQKLATINARVADRRQTLQDIIDSLTTETHITINPTTQDQRTIPLAEVITSPTTHSPDDQTNFGNVNTYQEEAVPSTQYQADPVEEEAPPPPNYQEESLYQADSAEEDASPPNYQESPAETDIAPPPPPPPGYYATDETNQSTTQEVNIPIPLPPSTTPLS